MNLKKYLGVLIVGVVLATGHAIRGQFGHEQGAAWAGGAAGLAIVLVSRRKDWYLKSLLIALSCAIGWGAGGMISYGQIAGSYSQSDNFINTFYGLSMLFVIGGLYGLLGGGLVGLTLEETENKRVKWGVLVTQMVAGALIVHTFLIEQIGLRATPPRGDAWALCLGAGFAMLWYMARNKHFSPLRVSVYATLGAGFGFSFGTFFHLVMNWVEIPFNTWNMAEYAIGLFGGIGMAYGVFTSKWPDEYRAPLKWEQIISLLIVLVFIPLIIFRESFFYTDFAEKFQQALNPDEVAVSSVYGSGLIILMMIAFVWQRIARANYVIGRKEIFIFMVTYLVGYALLSYISTGVFAGLFHANHHLYFVNIALVIWLLGNKLNDVFIKTSQEIESKRWLILFMLALISIAVMAVLAIEVHGPTPERYDRFPV